VENVVDVLGTPSPSKISHQLVRDHVLAGDDGPRRGEDLSTQAQGDQQQHPSIPASSPSDSISADVQSSAAHVDAERITENDHEQNLLLRQTVGERPPGEGSHQANPASGFTSTHESETETFAEQGGGPLSSRSIGEQGEHAQGTGRAVVTFPSSEGKDNTTTGEVQQVPEKADKVEVAETTTTRPVVAFTAGHSSPPTGATSSADPTRGGLSSHQTSPPSARQSARLRGSPAVVSPGSIDADDAVLSTLTDLNRSTALADVQEEREMSRGVMFAEMSNTRTGAGASSSSSGRGHQHNSSIAPSRVLKNDNKNSRLHLIRRSESFDGSTLCTKNNSTIGGQHVVVGRNNSKDRYGNGTTVDQEDRVATKGARPGTTMKNLDLLRAAFDESTEIQHIRPMSARTNVMNKVSSSGSHTSNHRPGEPIGGMYQSQYFSDELRLDVVSRVKSPVGAVGVLDDRPTTGQRDGQRLLSTLADGGPQDDIFVAGSKRSKQSKSSMRRRPLLARVGEGEQGVPAVSPPDRFSRESGISTTSRRSSSAGDMKTMAVDDHEWGRGTSASAHIIVKDQALQMQTLLEAEKTGVPLSSSSSETVVDPLIRAGGALSSEELAILQLRVHRLALLNRQFGAPYQYYAFQIFFTVDDTHPISPVATKYLMFLWRISQIFQAVWLLDWALSTLHANPLWAEWALSLCVSGCRAFGLLCYWAARWLVSQVMGSSSEQHGDSSSGGVAVAFSAASIPTEGNDEAAFPKRTSRSRDEIVVTDGRKEGGIRDDHRMRQLDQRGLLETDQQDTSAEVHHNVDLHEGSSTFTRSRGSLVPAVKNALLQVGANATAAALFTNSRLDGGGLSLHLRTDGEQLLPSSTTRSWIEAPPRPPRTTSSRYLSSSETG
ncbi:unnamed protein product, partial [Amoebophrya sp. A25]